MLPIQSNAQETSAETSKQLWANFILSRPKSERLYFEYDIEDDKPPERFASKRRIRLGVGYRHSYEWRFEVLAMRDEAKETLEDEIDVDAYMLNFRIKWFL